MFLVKKKIPYKYFIEMVHKRSEKKLQERKNKSFSNNKRKREEVSGHLEPPRVVTESAHSFLELFR